MATLAEIREQYPQYGDMSDQQLADALHSRFYSDIPRADFDRRVGFSAADGAGQVPASTQQGRASGAFDAFTQGASFGFGDELTAAEAAVLGRTPQGEWFNYEQPFEERYDRALAAERGQQGAFAEQNPTLAAAAQIAGGVAGAAAPLGASLRAAQGGTALARATAGGAAAGAQGAVYGFGEGEGGLRNRLENAAVVGATSAAIGGIAAPVIGKGVRSIQTRVANSRFGKQLLDNVPSAEDIQNVARRLYDQADDAGLVIKAKPFGDMARRLSRELQEEGIDPDITPASTKALSRIVNAADSGDAIRLRDLETLRKVAGRAASKDSSERAFGTAIKRELDDFLVDLSPDDIAAGDVSGARLLKEARDMWARASRTELLEDAVLRAETRAAASGSGGNTNNAIRQEVRRLLTHKKFRRAFNKDEIEYLNRVVRGSKAENVARLVGKLSPSTGGGAAMLNYLGLGGAGLAGSPTASALVLGSAGLSTGAKALADRATARNAALARALVAGGRNNALPVVDNSRRILAEQLIQRGAGAGVGPLAP